MEYTELTLDLALSLLHPRAKASHKGDFGTLTAVCGSVRFRGAASLAVKAALRGGVGIVRLASAEPVIQAVAAKVDECVFEPLPSSESGSIAFSALEPVVSLAEKSTALLIGCGLSVTEDTRALLFGLLPVLRCPLVLDADALNILSEAMPSADLTAGTPILTPHLGEMSRLTGLPIARIKEAPGEVALDFARTHHCVLVLKDSVTCIASPEGTVYRNSVENPGLAKGGSGDVLAGLIASLAAQGYPPLDAARIGVKLHSEAALSCARRLSCTGMLPSDLLTDLCSLLCRCGY